MQRDYDHVTGPFSSPRTKGGKASFVIRFVKDGKEIRAQRFVTKREAQAMKEVLNKKDHKPNPKLQDWIDDLWETVQNNGGEVKDAEIIKAKTAALKVAHQVFMQMGVEDEKSCELPKGLQNTDTKDLLRLVKNLDDDTAATN